MNYGAALTSCCCSAPLLSSRVASNSLKSTVANRFIYLGEVNVSKSCRLMVTLRIDLVSVCYCVNPISVGILIKVMEMDTLSFSISQ